MDFEVVIIGSDINAYYMARNCYEEYHKKPYLIIKERMKYTTLSNIVNIEEGGNLWDTKIFNDKLVEFAKKHNDKKLVLIPSNDFYVRLIVENKKLLEKYYTFYSIDEKLLNNILIKDNFYTAFKDSGLEFPKTYIYDCKEKKKLTKKEIKDFMFPIIIKPGDGVCYYNHHFDGQAKVYKVNSLDKINSIIEKINNSGYEKNLIIQEFIPGGDDQLFDSIFFCNKKKKAELATFAQIGLQEHTSTGIGNCTVLVNGYNEHGDPTEQIKKMKSFLEKIGYEGCAEFDLKYDVRDNKYKVFEINPRQARSSYYLTAAGFNILKYMIDDLVYDKKNDFHIITNEVALTFVPMTVIKKNIKNEKLKKEIIKLKKEKKLVNPLKYKQDMTLKRRMWLLLRDINYIKKYDELEW